MSPAVIQKHSARVPKKGRYTDDERQLMNLALMCEIAREYERRGNRKEAAKCWRFVEEYPLEELIARLERAAKRKAKGARR